MLFSRWRKWSKLSDFCGVVSWSGHWINSQSSRGRCFQEPHNWKNSIVTRLNIVWPYSNESFFLHDDVVWIEFLFSSTISCLRLISKFDERYFIVVFYCLLSELPLHVEIPQRSLLSKLTIDDDDDSMLKLWSTVSRDSRSSVDSCVVELVSTLQRGGDDYSARPPVES